LLQESRTDCSEASNVWYASEHFGIRREKEFRTLPLPAPHTVLVFLVEKMLLKQAFFDATKGHILLRYYATFDGFPLKKQIA